MHKSPTPVRHSRMNQARSEEEEKETGKTEARRLIERKAAQKNLLECKKVAYVKTIADLSNPTVPGKCILLYK